MKPKKKSIWKSSIKLTIVSYGDIEAYCPIVLIGGKISGKKLHDVVRRKFKEEIKKDPRIDGWGIRYYIAKYLCDKYGFKIPDIDEFYMDSGRPGEERYWKRGGLPRS
jgi:hypothetical protein